MKFLSRIQYYKKQQLSPDVIIKIYLKLKNDALSKITFFKKHYPSQLVEQAFKDYTQKKIIHSPRLMFPSEAGLAFYHQLNLKARKIVTEYGRIKLKNKVESFGLDPKEYTIALQFLERARSPKIKQLLQPGQFADYLDSKNFFKK